MIAMKRRSFLFLSTIGMLAGCQTTTQSSERTSGGGAGSNPPGPTGSGTATNAKPSPSTIQPNKVLTPEMTTDFRVVDVTVGFADDFKQNPNGVQHPRAEIKKALQRNMDAYLNASLQNGSRPVRIEALLTKSFIKSQGVQPFQNPFGETFSNTTLVAQVSVYDAGTDEKLGFPIVVQGTPLALVTSSLIGSVASGGAPADSPAEKVDAATARLALNTRNRLFGDS